jgi:hypothetical protein
MNGQPLHHLLRPLTALEMELLVTTTSDEQIDENALRFPRTCRGPDYLFECPIRRPKYTLACKSEGA